MGTRNTGTAGGILGILRDGRPRTKTELAALTDQPRSTVGQRLDALMAAHRQFGGPSALQNSSGFLRNATFDMPLSRGSGQ